MSIIITGVSRTSEVLSSPLLIHEYGAGFIDSHLVDRLLDDGKNVAVIDSLSTSSLAGCHYKSVVF